MSAQKIGTGPVMAARDITVSYPGRAVITRPLDLEIRPGSFVAIVGRNACGKSTLLRALARLLPPSTGQVVLDGKDIAARQPKEFARTVGLLAQTSTTPDGMRVGELIARGRYPHRASFSPWSTADEDAVRSAMVVTDTAALAGRSVGDLSGGQRQRVWLAMLLAQQTPILLLDEPTTFLDLAHQIEMLDLFRTINRRDGRTIVAVLHDLNQAARYADRIIMMRDGSIVGDGAPREALTAERIEEVFGVPCCVIDDPVTGTPLVVTL